MWRVIALTKISPALRKRVGIDFYGPPLLILPAPERAGPNLCSRALLPFPACTRTGVLQWETRCKTPYLSHIHPSCHAGGGDASVTGRKNISGEIYNMAEQVVYLTREGYERLRAELEYLRTVRRQEVARRLHEALADGDILENAELEAARNEQAFVEGRIMELEMLLGAAEVIEEEAPSGTVNVGSRVTVVEGDGPPEVYHIVGPAEASPSEGKISYESPLGKALLGHRVGDEVRVNAPARTMVFRILDIR